MSNKLKTQLAECLKSLVKLKEVKEKIKAEGKEEALNEFETSLKELVDETTKGYKDFISNLVSGNEITKQVTDTDLFEKLSEEVLSLEENSDWNEENASLFLASYLKNGGKIEVEADKLQEKVLIKDLYNLEDSNEFALVESYLTNQQKQNFPDNLFLGENKTIPITSRFDVLNYIFLLEKNNISIDSNTIKKLDSVALNFGILQTLETNETENKFTVKVSHCPITVLNKETNQVFYPIKIETEEEAKEALELVETVSAAYSLSEAQKTQVKGFVEELLNEKEYFFKKAPLFNTEKKFTSSLTLGSEFLFNTFVKSESNVELKDVLSKLVGITRRNELTMEAIEEAGKAYSIFGVSVLKKLLNVVSNKKEKETSKVEQIASPVLEASPVSKDEATSLKSQKTELVSLVEEYAAKPKTKTAKRSTVKSISGDK